VRWCDLAAADIHDTRRFGTRFALPRRCVMHFAALASVGDSVLDPSAYYGKLEAASACCA